jgi:hypothetical protein
MLVTQLRILCPALGAPRTLQDSAERAPVSHLWLKDHIQRLGSKGILGPQWWPCGNGVHIRLLSYCSAMCDDSGNKLALWARTQVRKVSRDPEAGTTSSVPQHGPGQRSFRTG